MVGKLFSHGDEVASGANAAANVAEGLSDATKVADKSIDGTKSVSGAERTVHGNSLESTNTQHRYEIVNNQTGDVVKTGISGKPLNANGTSGRANSQVNALNKQHGAGTYSASVPEKSISGRRAALAAEKKATNQLKKDGHSLELQKRPQPDER